MLAVPVNSKDGQVGWLKIDEQDLALLEGRSVHFFNKIDKYPCIKLRGNKVMVHRVIAKAMGLIDYLSGDLFVRMVIDHIDGDKTNCTRANLRLVTAQENTRNRSKPRRGSKSGLKGVSWSKRANKWYACIMLDGVHKYIGVFEDKYDAGRAYDAKALELFGSFATTNAMLGLYPEQG